MLALPASRRPYQCRRLTLLGACYASRHRLPTVCHSRLLGAVLVSFVALRFCLLRYTHHTPGLVACQPYTCTGSSVLAGWQAQWQASVLAAGWGGGEVACGAR